MQFIYNPNASQNSLTIKDENYRYLFKARRLKIGDEVQFRNLLDDLLYHYLVEDIGKKEATLRLKDAIKSTKDNLKKLHIIWCIIDPKIVYSTLPMLNQMGVFKISFVYCDRSQKNFKIDLGKCQKILINSCQQCGRTDLLGLENFDTLKDVIQKYQDFAVLDFGGEKELLNISSVLIGCEGGFSEDERKMLQDHQKIGLKTGFILKSETATIAIASKILI